MDLSMFRQLCLSDGFVDISSELTKYQYENWQFYYDESNNIRKLWLDEKDFNAPIYNDFVLGGVMIFEQSSVPDVEGLKKELRLQQSSKEIKFKHISKSKDFLGCLSEEKIRIFLQWLYQSDLYVHFSNINNLYWTIIDIVDSIEDPLFIPLNIQMKNELYKIASSNYDGFYKLLVNYNYPNIDKDSIAPFYQGIIDFIDNVPPVELSFEIEILRQGLEVARKQEKLTFLDGNKEKTVIDSYFVFYLRLIGLFPSSQHIFDNESQIEEQFKKYRFLHGANKADNFNFIDSICSPLVQVSDCVVGLIGKYYTYINSINLKQVQQLFESITPEQKQTLNLFAQVIYKSENFSKLLLHSVQSIEEHDVGAYILQHAR